MEIEFNKYAILIGIDDYKENPGSTIKLKPLKGCVKDIQNMKKTLLNKCGFKERNIYTIESTEEKTESEIRNKIDILLKNIDESFEKGKDSIYFHFSGHGLLNEASSYIMLHSSPLEVLEIPRIIDGKLKPKHQFYTFDCCHCGEITYIRGSETEEEKIKNYFEKSSGMAILYACKKTQKALETAEGGKLTNSMIKIISDMKYYDKDKILSSGTLIEQVKKEMINEKQEPIGISETSGYYPFAAETFWKKIEKIELEESEKGGLERNMIEIIEEFEDKESLAIFSDKNKFITYRRETMEFFLEILKSNIQNILTEKGIVYSITDCISDDDLPRIYNSLNFIPLSSGLKKIIKVKERKNPFMTASIFNRFMEEQNETTIEYRLGGNALVFSINYLTNEEFSNKFEIGIIILPLQFGINITFLLTDEGFESDKRNISLENLNFEVMESGEIERKKEIINSYFYKKIKELVDRNIEKNKKINKVLKEEYSKYKMNVVKF